MPYPGSGSMKRWAPDSERFSLEHHTAGAIPVHAQGGASMERVRVEMRNGLEVRMHTMAVRHVRPAACPERTAANGSLVFVQVVKDGKVFVNWHLPRLCRRWSSRAEAESEALEYAVRLVNRRPFCGPPPDVVEAVWRWRR